MFSGTHITMFSHDAEADRAFLRDTLRLPAIDAGGGWLIFALPRAELGVHPAEADGAAATGLYLMTEDVAGLVAELAGRNVAADAVTDVGSFDPYHAAQRRPARHLPAAPREAARGLTIVYAGFVLARAGRVVLESTAKTEGFDAGHEIHGVGRCACHDRGWRAGCFADRRFRRASHGGGLRDCGG